MIDERQLVEQEDVCVPHGDHVGVEGARVDPAGMLLRKEGTRGFDLAQARERFRGLAHIRKILLVANGFLRELEHSFQQAFVQLHDIQRSLPRRKPLKVSCPGGFGRVQQQSTVCRHRQQSRAAASFLVQQRRSSSAVHARLNFLHLE